MVVRKVIDLFKENEFQSEKDAFFNLDGFLEDRFSDVTVIFNHFRYRLHRIVLARCSRVLHIKFLNSSTAADITMDEITFLTEEEFKKLIKFMYSGEIEVTTEREKWSFSSVASLYQMRTLQQKCDQLGEKVDKTTYNKTFDDNKSSESPIRCLYTNATSIKDRKTRDNKLKDMKDRFNGNIPHVIGITETWFTDTNTDTGININVEGVNYEVFLCNIGEGKGKRAQCGHGDEGAKKYGGTQTGGGMQSGGGVAICVQSDLKPNLLDCFSNPKSNPNPSSEFIDQVWCTVTHKGVNGLIGCIYQPCLTSKRYLKNKLAADNEIKESINQAKKYVEDKKFNFLLIMGDFNNPNLKWNKDVQKMKGREIEFIETLRKNELQQFVHFPTFPSHTMLGLVIVKCNDKYSVSVLSKLTIMQMHKSEIKNKGIEDFINNHSYAIDITDSCIFDKKLLQKQISKDTLKSLVTFLQLKIKKDDKWWERIEYAIVGDFKSAKKNWPKNFEFNINNEEIKFTAEHPNGNILDLLITSNGAKIENLKQYDPLGEKRGHSVLAFDCIINDDSAQGSLAQCGSAQSGSAQSGSAQCGSAQSGSAHCGSAQARI